MPGADAHVMTQPACNGDRPRCAKAERCRMVWQASTFAMMAEEAASTCLTAHEPSQVVPEIEQMRVM
jgi:hypothetical protein